MPEGLFEFVRRYVALTVQARLYHCFSKGLTGRSKLVSLNGLEWEEQNLSLFPRYRNLVQVIDKLCKITMSLIFLRNSAPAQLLVTLMKTLV